MNITNPIILALAVSASALAVSAADETTNTQRRNATELPSTRRDPLSRSQLGTLERASQLIASSLVDPGGEKLGKVKDLAVDLEAGRVLEVVVVAGGVIGVGEKLTALPPDLASRSESGVKVSTDLEKLKSAPDFDLDQWAEGTEQTSIEARRRHFAGGSAGQASTLDRDHRAGGKGVSESPRYVERASRLIGMQVNSLTGDKVGKVEDLVVDLGAGRVIQVVVSTGGFLGIGDELSAVPPSVFRYGADRGTLVLQAGREVVQSAPRFKDADWSQQNSADQVGEVYRAYGVKPYFETRVAADNSQRNLRDRKSSSLTPLDQGNSESDIKITAEIRRKINREEGLSVAAKNIKVITVNGRVTLRGPVQAMREKERIESIANGVAGVEQVNNELEVITETK
ncbi:MAG: PRC-barrel domain-containing protein [Verrucomicrobiales bacterium]|nr:PRC-barrel domain-containing protein [Verrucomicrobiales bacterium]